MKILLSIKPEFASKIFDGTKVFEFRRSLYKRNIDTAVVYVTRPVCMFVGEFSIEGILQGRPEDIWIKTKAGAGITKSFYDSYFDGREVAYALRIGQIFKYSEPVNPVERISSFVPPQSFMYLNDDLRRIDLEQRDFAF
jgi:predicted transcriptional regulator